MGATVGPSAPIVGNTLAPGLNLNPSGQAGTWLSSLINTSPGGQGGINVLGIAGLAIVAWLIWTAIDGN
jgi:hypothetical protein